MRKPFHKYHDGQTVKVGDLIATSRLGHCKITKIGKDECRAYNIFTNEKIKLCGIALSDSDLLKRKGENRKIKLDKF